MKPINTLPALLFISLLSSPSWSETVDDLVYHYENGQISWKFSFENGKKEGASVSYHENGQIWEKGIYKNGKMEGVWVSYNKDGTVDKEYAGTYKNNVKISD